MKTIVAVIVLFLLTMGAYAQLTTNQPARREFKVIRFDGKIDSSIPASSDICSTPEAEMIGTSHEDKETTPGHECDLKWKFIGRSNDTDVYQFTFTRMTKAGSSIQTTSSREVPFDGKRSVVFDDDLHTVVMESPSESDLKAAQTTN
jgi:hypothetical protein